MLKNKMAKWLGCALLVSIPILINAQTTVKENDLHGKLDTYVWSQSQYQLARNKNPVIDFEAIDNWEHLTRDLSISPNGQYLAYGISTNREGRLDTLVVQSADGGWRRTFTNAKPGFFSSDSRQYIIEKENEICFLDLGSEKLRCIEGVDKVTWDIKNAKNQNWLAWQLKDTDKTVVLQNLVSGEERRFKNVSSFGFDRTCDEFYYHLNDSLKQLIICNLVKRVEKSFSDVSSFSFSPSGNQVLLKSTNKRLIYGDIVNDKTVTIWEDPDKNLSVTGYAFDNSGVQVVLIVQKNEEEQKTENSVWYWHEGMKNAVLKVNNRSHGIGSELRIQGSASFTFNDRYIQFGLKPETPAHLSSEEGVQLNIWSYQDKVLQPTQQWASTQPAPTYSAILNISTGQVIQLESEYEKIKNWISGDYAVVVKECGGDRFWESVDSNFLVSLHTGTRQLLPVKGTWYNDDLTFSPDGRYLIYFDKEKVCNYFSYDLKKGSVNNISAGTLPYQFGFKDIYLRTFETPKYPMAFPVAWVGSNGLLVYDNYDIWQLDLTGITPPVNITNGYGFTHHTRFELSGGGIPRFKVHDTLLLKAFDRTTKFSGYYRKILGSRGNPELLYMGPSSMERVSMTNMSQGMVPLKAVDAEIWVVRREAANESPNYFLTRDFRTYKQITYHKPQHKYNWYTTELHSFKQLDGTLSQGVLYKPENFDSTQKYPVIISFYGSLSDQLYKYLVPNYIQAPFLFNSPAWMVSHGYLVFVPDIYFTKGQWGPSTVNTLDGVARYLKKLPYVDAAHLGATGHSNSGRFGYYLFTHSNSFAAMCVGSGSTNVLNTALSLTLYGKIGSQLYWAEEDAVGSGLGNLWKNKKSWLDQTSVLHADNASSPLLMFHSQTLDNPVEQAIQMYTALRRLDKKVWWLEYPAGHVLDELKELRDFTVRYSQYFDHYLKNSPPPRWMTQGIPYKLKGIEARYKLDPAGSCAMKGKNHCYVCEAWNKQYKRTPAMFEKEIKYWALDKDLKAELDKKTKAERAKLDKEQVVEDKKIVDILKHGYPEDKRSQKN